jgi:epoxyqueuosine reductase QueG
MDKHDFEKMLKDFTGAAPGNFIARDLSPELAGMRIFDEPIFGYAAADDPLFLELKKPGVIGSHFLPPCEWLPEAKTVIPIFLPFTEQVRMANRQNMDWPAQEWLHAQIEGRALQNKICRYAADWLNEKGFAAIAPMIDSRFSSKNPEIDDKNEQTFYTSNWSERHAAYIGGLGTFGLSKGLITRRGIAGRFTSLITSAPFEAEQRPYTGIYDYCTSCGVCAKNCPSKAISLEKGKIHHICSDFLNKTKEKFKPLSGCGKCQVKVPCESRIPAGIS